MYVLVHHVIPHLCVTVPPRSLWSTSRYVFMSIITSKCSHHARTNQHKRSAQKHAVILFNLFIFHRHTHRNMSHSDERSFPLRKHSASCSLRACKSLTAAAATMMGIDDGVVIDSVVSSAAAAHKYRRLLPLVRRVFTCAPTSDNATATATTTTTTDGGSREDIAARSVSSTEGILIEFAPNGLAASDEDEWRSLMTQLNPSWGAHGAASPLLNFGRARRLATRHNVIIATARTVRLRSDDTTAATVIRLFDESVAADVAKAAANPSFTTTGAPLFELPIALIDPREGCECRCDCGGGGDAVSSPLPTRCPPCVWRPEEKENDDAKRELQKQRCLVGTAQLDIHYKQCETLGRIDDVVVDASVRRQGVAHSLVSALVAVAKDRMVAEEADEEGLTFVVERNEKLAAIAKVHGFGADGQWVGVGDAVGGGCSASSSSSSSLLVEAFAAVAPSLDSPYHLRNVTLSSRKPNAVKLYEKMGFAVPSTRFMTLPTPLSGTAGLAAYPPKPVSAAQPAQ